MKTLKTVFVVKGSEDGNLGVFSNMKLAFARAIEYAESNGKPIFLDYKNGKMTKAVATYAGFTKRMKGYAFVEIENTDGFGTALVEKFYLNRN